jgi:hypothetical protein
MLDQFPELKWFASGRGHSETLVDFSTGNSGNRLHHAVVKIGNECQQEGAFCQLLGRNVTPEVYSLIPNGYVMEALEPAKRDPYLLCEIESVLQNHVWGREAPPVSTDVSWKEKLKIYGVDAPDWAIMTRTTSLVHGDPTASNALRRGKQLVICDPRPPRDFIPPYIETDCGRILQSFMGWEVSAYGAEPVKFHHPDFMDDPYLYVAARFWCGAAAARIEYLERSRSSRPNILEWCQKVRKMCHV